MQVENLVTTRTRISSFGYDLVPLALTLEAPVHSRGFVVSTSPGPGPPGAVQSICVLGRYAWTQ